MKTYRIIISMIVLLTVPVYAQAQKAYIGVLLDTEPLPPLLIKHLQLNPDQGLRIRNVHTGGPADQAGLQRDDILIQVNGDTIDNLGAFVETVSGTKIGEIVSLELIHLGQRRKVNLTVSEKSDDFHPKYPPEPERIQTWRPGKVFHFDDNQDNWLEYVFEGPGNRTQNLFKEHYSFHFDQPDCRGTVSIQGNPHEGETTIIVESRNETYNTTIGETEALPDQIRTLAERAVKQAKKNSRQHTRIRVLKDHSQALKDVLEEHQPDQWKTHTDTMLEHMKDLIDKHDLPKSLDQLKDRHSDQLQNIEKKLDELYKRLDRMEKKKPDHDRTQEPSHMEKKRDPHEAPGLQTIKRSTRPVRRTVI